ncbi:MAG: methyltransferase domain-containing protein [Dehalococcoidia bacterium]|nr:methyltransferase domain-containing protein [Dehalococcoidia bacterium]
MIVGTTWLRGQLYRLAQLRQSRAKFSKDATFRLAPAIDMILASTALPYSAAIVCVGARNRIEPDLWRARGFRHVEALDLLSSDGVRGMDMHRLAFADDSFDLYFASHALEHALEPKRALAEAVRVLRPGGYLYAAFPVGFTPNQHDRWDYGGVQGFCKHLPERTRWRIIWGANRDGECRLLLEVGRRLNRMA